MPAAPRTAHKLPLSVLVVVYSADLQVLLLERADFPDGWQSVTGSSETGEALMATAARELREETGLESSAGVLDDWRQENRYEIYPRWRHRYAPGVTHNTEHVFGFRLAAPRDVKPDPREHTRWLWLPWQAAADKVFSPSNAAALRDLPRRAARDS